MRDQKQVEQIQSILEGVNKNDPAAVEKWNKMLAKSLTGEALSQTDHAALDMELAAQRVSKGKTGAKAQELRDSVQKEPTDEQKRADVRARSRVLKSSPRFAEVDEPTPGVDQSVIDAKNGVDQGPGDDKPGADDKGDKKKPPTRKN